MSPIGRSQPQTPSALTAVVTEVKVSGATVVLPGGKKGWLPGREVYPDFRPHEDFRERATIRPGDKLEVVTFDTELGGVRALVSRLRIASDPWHEVTGWQDGELKTMEVTAQPGNRALGLIDPGIGAEVRWETVKRLLPPSWGGFQKLLIGDEVAGYFRWAGVDEERRIVSLDMAGYVHSDVAVSDLLASSLPHRPAITDAPKQVRPDPGLPRRLLDGVAFEDVQEILVVDDDRAFREAVGAFLETHHCHVVTSGDAADAIALIDDRTRDFDLALIDIQLTPQRNHEGLGVARHLQEQQSKCAIVVISGDDIDREQCRLAAKDLFVSHFAFKPFGYQELHISLGAAKNLPRPLLDVLPGGTSPDIEPQSGATSHRQADELRTAAKRLLDEISGEAVVLFSIHPVSHTVEIVTTADPENLCSVVHRRLDTSPVYDVAIRHENILENDARGSAKHRFLERAYGYASCIGIPVELGYGTTLAYALFAFHWRPGKYGEVERWAATRTAKEMGLLLANMQLENELRQMKPFELMGKVYGSMAHDLSSVLSRDFELREAIEAITTGKGGVRGKNPEELLIGLWHRMDEAKDIVTTFRNMARGIRTDITQFALGDVLERTVHAFLSVARAHGSTVEFRPCTGPPCVVQMRESGLMIVLGNLLLNAAQQIERLRCLRAGEGQIVVELQRRTDAEGDWAVVLVHDTGPGIHRRDFDRVFDMHYTTKPDGCGMGLDIARNIATDVVRGSRRGSLRVRRSILLAGTTFELTLPIERQST